MRIAGTFAIALVGLALSAGSARAADLWLHVHVDEKGTDGARVRVNLPITLVEKAVAMIPEDQMRNGKLVLEDNEISVAELRELWRELAKTPDATLVEVFDEEHVKVSKRGGYLLVETVEPGDNGQRVDVRVPAEVVEALLSSGDDQLDVAAAVRALAARGAGELVMVHDAESQVRIWVDANAESL
jgi:hypothetical protein